MKMYCVKEVNSEYGMEVSIPLSERKGKMEYVNYEKQNKGI